MIELKNEKIAIPVVLIAGLFWSFGPLVVRYMDNPHMVPWQYIFGRGLTIFIILNLYLYFEEGINFYKNYKKVGKSGLVGGIGLGIAMISFIYSITNTTAAITLLCLAAMPFFTALLAFLFLKEKISLNVWISMLIATVGIIIMAVGNTEKNSLISHKFILHDNFPNPFNPSTNISYSISNGDYVSINIFDVNGGKVREIFNDYRSAGTYSINWNGENDRGVQVSAGVYLYSIDVGEFWQTKKMILLK